MFKSFKSLKAIGLFALGTFTFQDTNKFAESLGIMGYIGKDPKAFQVILEGLEQVPSSEYDSAGVVTLHGSEARVSNYMNSSKISALSQLKQDAFHTHSSSSVGLGHLHLSTRKDLSDSLSNPQSDHRNRILIVHEGSITNLPEIQSFIESRQIPVKSSSATELLAILIGIFVEDGHPLKVATRLALEKAAGTSGLVAVDKQNPGQLIVAQKGSSLFMSMHEGEIVVSSQEKVLKGKVMRLEDSCVYSLDPQRGKIESMKIKDADSLVSLGSAPHWTIKEIEEQPQAIARSLNYGARLTSDSARLKGLEEIKNEFLGVKNLVLLGCGSSFHACQFGSHIMKHLELMDTVTSADPSSSQVYLPFKNPGAILISESGETTEILAAGQLCIGSKVPSISIVNQISSSLAQMIGHGVYMNAGKEVAEAGTKSFLSSCVVLIEIALWLSKFKFPEKSEYRKRIINSLLSLPMMAGSVIARNKDDAKLLANELKGEEHVFVLGRGMGESIAYEGASLLKQLSLVHAEGYAGGALKHGPFALINDGRPIILIILDDEHKDMMNLALAEVQARNAKTIVITPNKNLITCKEPPHKILLIEENGPLTGLLAIIPLQLLAYYLSIQREIDPDFPSSADSLINIS